LKKWSVLLVILGTVCLVALPIVMDRMDGVRNRWSLARVANMADRGNEMAEAELARAIVGLREPEKEKDYWNVRLKIALSRGSGDEAIEVVERALRAIPEFRNIALLAYLHFYENLDFEYALRARLLFYGGRELEYPEVLNEIAYLRSLALVDLDQGLEEINKAIRDFPNSAAFLDTRAWVLFQMGRPKEALVDANRAVEIAVAQFEAAQYSFSNRLSRWLGGRAQPSSDDGLLNELEAGQELWSLGVLHYHRGRILESLGRVAEAQEMWQWLEDRQLPKDDRMR
jgi:tetratricopeptide (TPR) repeat protein